jgi:hypothetical protein
MKISPVGAKLSHADGQTDMKLQYSLLAILRTSLKTRDFVNIFIFIA